MKVWQVLALSALVLFATIGAHADGASTRDARIIVGSGGDPTNCGLPDFTFKSTGKGDGTLDCVNSSGEDWIGLTITGIAKIGKIDFGPGGLACDGKTLDPTNLFAGCNAVVTVDPKNKNQEFVTITFFDGEITPKELFFINLNDDPKKNGKGGTKKSWIGSLVATPEVAPVPEPGTITLLLTGWGGVWFWRRQQSSKLNG
jgi:hypothetical protein